MNRFVGEVDKVPWARIVKGVRPEIHIRPGEQHRLVREAEDALLTGGRVYQVGGNPAVVGHETMPTLDGERKLLRRVLLTSSTMVTELAQAADWCRRNAKSGRAKPSDPPRGVADHLLNQRLDLRLPVLTGIVTAPQLRSDGQILEPGYDKQTGLYFDPSGVDFPAVPGRPSRDEARAALDRLARPFRGVPFVDPVSRAVALASLLTPFARRAFRTAPGIGYTSPVAGSGKTILANAAALLATGEPSAAISVGTGSDELEKRIGAMLLSGRPYVTLDNIDHANWSVPLLCTALTEESVPIRILGASKMIDVQNVATIAATGNNLVIPGDLTRRFLLCRLDPGVERPELRAFDFDLRQEIIRLRAELAGDALTVLRAHLVAGQPRAAGVVDLGSFEEWSRFIRDALVWLGEADPVTSMDEIRESDPGRATLDAMMQAWAALGAPGDGRKSASQLIEFAQSHPEWRGALQIIAARGKDTLCPIRLGHWLTRNKSRVVNGRRIEKCGASNGVSVYQLVTVPAGKGEK
jgi:hypothetical protein